jgi:hypothetical protein
VGAGRREAKILTRARSFLLHGIPPLVRRRDAWAARGAAVPRRVAVALSRRSLSVRDGQCPAARGMD